MMKIEKFVLGPLATNCYLLKNEKIKELVIVDPAICPDYMISHVKNEGYAPKAIFLTHGHFDHVMGIEGWVKEFGIPVYLHEEEKALLADAGKNMSGSFAKQFTYEDVYGLQDGDVLEVAGLTFKVIHTPGHTAGGCCYYEEAEEVLITGDTLFRFSVGRSDLPTGNASVLRESIREKLFCLPNEVMVYPGHGEFSCIGDEKGYNPFI